MKLTPEIMRKIDWAGMEKELLFKFRVYAKTCQSLDDSPVSKATVEDVLGPVFLSLAEFMEAIDFEKEGDDEA